MSHREPWGPQQNRELIAFADAGMSRAEVAARLGRTEAAVKVHASALSIRFKRDTYGGLPLHAECFVTDEHRTDMRARSTMLVRAIAAAMWRGDHLPGASNAV